jgi:hypothetical protein
MKKWVTSISGKLLTGEARSTRRETCRDVTLSTTSTRWTGLRSNPDHRCLRLATKYPSHGMEQKYGYKQLCLHKNVLIRLNVGVLICIIIIIIILLIIQDGKTWIFSMWEPSCDVSLPTNCEVIQQNKKGLRGIIMFSIPTASQLSAPLVTNVTTRWVKNVHLTSLGLTVAEKKCQGRYKSF